MTSIPSEIIHRWMWIRVILTIGIIPYVKTISQYIDIDYRIVLYFALLILDLVDSFPPETIHNIPIGIHWEYQMWDKIVDTLSYWYTLACYSNQLDETFKYALYYRTIGVILFLKTRKSIWLILFFDVVKEILVYRYLFENNNKYLFVVVILGIVFEIFHKSHLTQHDLKIF
jgi:hypothetical protein